jgi:hypothetical protein
VKHTNFAIVASRAQAGERLDNLPLTSLSREREGMREVLLQTTRNGCEWSFRQRALENPSRPQLQPRANIGAESGTACDAPRSHDSARRDEGQWVTNAPQSGSLLSRR